MKRCPQCRRDYYDDSLMYCLDDGVPLLDGPTVGNDPPTAILHDTATVGEAATKAQIYVTGPQSSTLTPLRTRLEFPGKLIVAVAASLAVVVGGFFGLRGLRASPEISSIAVMPFANGSGGPDLDYLSDGMTETLISSLSKLPSLNVKPRSLVFRYKGKDTDPRTLGSELGVQAVLNGRVVSRGNDLSMFVELVDASSEKVIWSQHYDRSQSDIVSLQSEIARDLSNKLKSGLSSEDEKKVTKSGTDNPEAYRLYLLGNSLAARRKIKDIQAALQNYRQAVVLDPNYVQAYIGIATAETFMAIYAGFPGAEALPKARAAAIKALEIDSNSAEAHNILGGVELFLNRDFAACVQETDRALELDPNLANAHRHRGIYLGWQGHFDESIAELRRSIEIEPLGVAANLNLAWALLYAGRVDESDVQLKAVQDIDPGFWFTEYQRFINSRVRGDHAAAVEHLARAQELRDMPDTAKFIREAFAKGGWEGFMRSAIADPEKSGIWDYYLASFAAEMGDKDKAFSFLNKGYDKYDQFVFFVKIDPVMNPLRDDPRLALLENKLGFKP